jgi:hypothetical protein
MWSQASPTAISRRRTNRSPRTSGNYGNRPPTVTVIRHPDRMSSDMPGSQDGAAFERASDGLAITL